MSNLDSTLQPQSISSTWLQWFFNFCFESEESRVKAKEFIEKKRKHRYHLSFLMNTPPKEILQDVIDIAKGIDVVGEVIIDSNFFNSKSYLYQVVQLGREEVVKILCGPDRSECVLFSKTRDGTPSIRLLPNRWYPVLNINPHKNLICHTRWDRLYLGNPYLAAIGSYLDSRDSYIESLSKCDVTSPLMIDDIALSSLIENVNHKCVPDPDLSNCESGLISKLLHHLPGNGSL